MDEGKQLVQKADFTNFRNYLHAGPLVNFLFFFDLHLPTMGGVQKPVQFFKSIYYDPFKWFVEHALLSYFQISVELFVILSVIDYWKR